MNESVETEGDSSQIEELNKRKLGEMIERVLAQKQSREERLQILAMKRSMDSPFVQEIRWFRPPTNFVQPQFKELFDGKSGDPVEHVQHFQASMSLWRYSDGFLCRCFPVTLTGKALTWFSQLESNSIANFGMLSDAFFEKYKINLGSKKGSNHLFGLHQETNESLVTLNKRFLQVGEAGAVDAGLIIEAYKNSLPYEEFGTFNSLTVQPVGNLKELYARAEKEKIAKLSLTKGTTEIPPKVRHHPDDDSKKKSLEGSEGLTG
ncbi:uncharacterized protein LOC113291202 [Papaver somniferum]|uniref:uncharacterized protein LOC113291202 n=1 Tax=Papaver somniferum TaxID=3469 RepID=UPI000E703C4C|nr:uncharacterized protein LOC113291202 [Papaver somniferum]